MDEISLPQRYEAAARWKATITTGLQLNLVTH